MPWARSMESALGTPAFGLGCRFCGAQQFLVLGGARRLGAVASLGRRRGESRHHDPLCAAVLAERLLEKRRVASEAWQKGRRSCETRVRALS
jgi:hypothetical protein